MVVATLLMGAAVAAVQADAQPAEVPAADAAAPATDSFKGEISKEDAEATISQCGARRFETTTETVLNGRARNAKILLCAKETDSDEQWAQTLEKAAAQLASSDALSAEAKAKLTGELQTAIAALRKPAPAPRSAAPRPTDVAEYSVLPPLPPPVAAPPPPALASVQPVVPSTGSVAPARPPVLAMARRPRVEVLCAAPGASSAASDCIDLDRDTVFAVRADQDLAGATMLQFARRGSRQPTGVQLAPAGLKSGQTARVRLPAQVCSGIAGGRIEVRVVGAGGADVLGSFGPYQLRC